MSKPGSEPNTSGYSPRASIRQLLARRDFLAAAGLILGAGSASVGIGGATLRTAGAVVPAGAELPAGEGHAPTRPCVIASANGIRATSRAFELIRDGFDPADAIVQGVRIIEDDPEDDSVGYGGLPNENGVVELDASVMHGPTHKSGAVAGLRGIKNPAQVALTVLRRTNHCLLVGEGALRFALAHGFREENLLTERARREWMAWRENHSAVDDWLDEAQRDAPSGKTWDLLPWEEPGTRTPAPGGGQNDGPKLPQSPAPTPATPQPSPPAAVPPAAPAPAPPPQGPEPATPAPKRSTARPFRMDVTGTVHCSGVTADGNIASCTSTSGLNWKIAGRVGDSPIIGAGNYCDNEIGAAGCTGRGEAAIVNLAAFRIVDLMGRGAEPTLACLEVAKLIVSHNREKRHRMPDGRPDFQVKLYAIRKDGAFGGAAIFSGAQYAVCDASGARLIDAPFLYERK